MCPRDVMNCLVCGRIEICREGRKGRKKEREKEKEKMTFIYLFLIFIRIQIRIFSHIF